MFPCLETAALTPIHKALLMSAILPAEIIELVIHETWMLPLINSKRLAFMKASLRISSWWLLAFLQESFTDVYLVSPKYSSTSPVFIASGNHFIF